jgi:flagellar basal-body rod protein FlgF
MGMFQTAAVQGALRQERRYNIITNNLGNSQTAGFKKDVLSFRKIVSEAMSAGQERVTESVETAFEQGEITPTGNPLDLAIDGPGFFKVKTPKGIRYTRAGQFVLNRENLLVNGSGYPVLGKGGEIRLNGRDIQVGSDGSLTAQGGRVGQLDVVTFPDVRFLRKEGHTLMKLEVPQEEIEVTESQVLQGNQESSNVNPMQEMMTLMDALRTFESCIKVIQASSEMSGKVVNEIGNTR